MKLRHGRLVSKLALWIGGIFLGFSPMLLMMVFFPEIASSLIESIAFVLKHSSNLSLPVPWPWTVRYGSLAWFPALIQFGIGALYVLMVIAYPLGLVTAWFTKP